MDSVEDEEFIDDLDGLEYNVITRPQELIDEQKRTSTTKILIDSTIDKPDFVAFKRTSVRKQSSKNKEKKSSLRHERKGSSKEKSSHKSPLDEGSPVKKSAELSKRYEALKKIIQRELGAYSKPKQKSEPLKIKKEECDLPVMKSKKFSQETNMNFDIPASKIMKEPAITPLQRFHVLDARDSALRTSISKPEGSKKVKIIGTCPDMCPEKERYNRITKNCVSVLEMTTTFDPNAPSRDADHSCMIKEYSRSSADQQEPLPHELRPVFVLKLTMEYLICNIIDKHYESISLEDWYDFIWNRTRSIRKDITQQQLCDPVCVEIIEKCVRFHIHCAEALSEEDTSAFDPKINNENLTKCLQTLKHMYEDLLSKGVESPNEAEFRSYDILLSLTEGETLGLIKDIRKDLLKSPQIKSAFKAALAFNSDNYVKFFQIVKEADYLSSCILHRYIIKVRSNALQIVVRAYSTQHNASMYPLSRLVDDLKFESKNEAGDFCRCHDLEANEEFIVIRRKHFSKSPSGLPLSRSSILVRHKKDRNLGLIINNGVLPPNPRAMYQPHNSFDENNLLKFDCLGAVSEEIGKDLFVDKYLEQEDEGMETGDDAPVESSHDSKFEESSKIEIPLQDSNSMVELEKRRAELLEELGEVESHNSAKLKQRSDRSKKQIEKKKSSKKTHSPSKSHTSIMFSSHKRDSIKPIKKVDDTSENKVQPVAISPFSSNKLPLRSESSFLKFDNLSSTNAFASTCAPNFAQQFSIPKVFTTASSLPVISSGTSNVFAQPSLPNSGFPTLSFQDPQKNFGFFFKPTTQVSLSDSAFTARLNRDASRHLSPFIRQSFSPPNLSASFRHEELKHVPSFSSEKISDAELSKTIPQEIRMSPEQAPEIITDNLENCSKEVIEKESCKMNAEEGICLPSKKIDELEEEKSRLETGEMSQAIASESLKDDSKGSDKENVEESDQESDIEERKKCELIDRFVNEVADELLFKVVEDCTPSICEEALNEERSVKAELENEVALFREQLAKYVIFRWRIFVQKRRERRLYENLAFYSPWQAVLLNIPRVSSGAISPFVAYKKHCSLNKTTAEILKKHFEVPPGWEKFNAEQVWTLNSFKHRYADASYFGKSGIKNFFKLCIVFPPVRDSNMTLFIEWIFAKFALQKTDPSKFDGKNVFRLHMGKTAVVVRAIELTPDAVEKHARLLDGVTAMMLFVPDNSQDRDTYLKNLTTVRDSSILDSPYPLYMYFMGIPNVPTDITSYVKMKIDLTFSAVNMQCIPDINNFVENSQKILSGLVWFNELKDKARPLPILKKISIRHYVEDAFSYVFSILLYKVSLDEYKFLLEDPQFIIDFYNRVMKFRASVLSNDFVKGIYSCWPPEELKDLLGEKFIDMQTQNLCKKALENLLLPDFKGDPYEDNNAWEYARLVPSSSSNIVLSIKISDSSVDWVRKIIHCAEHLIQNSDFILNKGDLSVFYIYEDILDFGCDPYWVNVLAEILPHRSSSSKRKKTLFDSCSPLKKSKVIPTSTPKVLRANLQNIFENASDICSSDKPVTFRYYSDVIERDIIREIDQPAKPVKENSTFEDTNILNYKLSSMAVGSVTKSSEVSHGKFSNIWTESSLNELNKENNILQEAESSSYKLPSKAVGSERKSSALFHNNLTNVNLEDVADETDNWKDIGIKKPSSNTWSSLVDRISELQYNVQKNSVLEDHFYELLNKQL